MMFQNKKIHRKDEQPFLDLPTTGGEHLMWTIDGELLIPKIASICIPGQGHRSADLMWTIDGELLIPKIASICIPGQGHREGRVTVISPPKRFIGLRIKDIPLGRVV
jgi:hypothetical protein